MIRCTLLGGSGKGFLIRCVQLCEKKLERKLKVKRDVPVLSREASPHDADRVHVVGIGGAGLRGMVMLLNQRGATVSGSEMTDSPVLERLRSKNIDCRVGHNETNVDEGTQLVVVSAAIDSDNPEVKAAQSRSIPVWKYSQCLGYLMSEKTGVAVAGTHGKTTTTAMVSQILHAANLDPSFLIGGDYPALGGGARWGSGPHFVAEACEYDRSFLNLKPNIAVVTNIDQDHLDYFESVADIQTAFGEFVGLLPADGVLVLNRDDPNSSYLWDRCRCPVTSFSLRRGTAEWWAEEITHRGEGCQFVARHRGGSEARVQLRVPGVHNVKNAMAALVTCQQLGVSLDAIVHGLAAFAGVRRRFDVLASGAVTVVDDYAHHPAEVESLAEAARSRFPHKRRIAVFQPHQHSRLKHFMEEFAAALVGFDQVIVVDVYRARDSDQDASSVRSGQLVDRLRARGVDACLAPKFHHALAEIEEVSDEAAILFLGAGDITDLAKYYAASLRERIGSQPLEPEASRQRSDPRLLIA